MSEVKAVPYFANIGTAQCIYAVWKKNKFLCGSGRERSVGDGMAVPERRTRFYKNWWEKELKYSMYKNTYSQSTQMLCITDIVHLVSTQKLT